jgi:glycerate 2-kinase
MTDPRTLMRQLADAAIQAANPRIRVPAILPEAQTKAIVVGAGKASAAMARALEETWPDTDLSGIVVTRYGYEVACERIEIVTAAHPVPDAAGREAALRILEMVA